MYIEDLITKVALSGMFTFNDLRMSGFANTKDFEILMSMSDQIELGNALTEKQAVLALRILHNHQNSINQSVPEITTALDNPKWKFPFRSLSMVRKISIEPHPPKSGFSGSECIFVRFPFSNDIVDQLRKRNPTVHDLHKGHWDNDAKSWIFNLTEKNIAFLGDLLIPMDFQIDEQFAEYYIEVCDIRKNVEAHIPLLVLDDNNLVIKNAHRMVTQPNTDNVIEALFNARRQGILTWDDAIQAKLDTHPNKITTAMLTTSRKKQFWVNSETVKVSEFDEVLNYGGRIMIVIPGGSELALTTKWVKFAVSQGIDPKNISVMFRLPNEKAEFNQYVKEAGVNNPVSDDTKIVFVSTKITKPIIKSGVRFDTVINLGYYNHMHYSMNVVLDNISNFVYYSMKAPIETKRWLPQEL